MCQPWAPEYVHTHRAVRQLAIQLSSRGWDVLRFDYYGTGDSAGASTEATLEHWIDDVGAAAAELRRAAGPLDEIVLIGLRLGATLALSAAPRLEQATSLVLWEPLENGEAHLAELTEAQSRWERRGSWFDARWDQAPGNGVADLLGFPATPRFIAELKALKAWTGSVGRLQRALLLERERRSATHELHAGLAAAGIDAVHEVVPDLRIWDALGHAVALVPRASLDRVVAWCARGAV
jgi:hypothetical protein